MNSDQKLGEILVSTNNPEISNMEFFGGSGGAGGCGGSGGCGGGGGCSGGSGGSGGSGNNGISELEPSS